MEALQGDSSHTWRAFILCFWIRDTQQQKDTFSFIYDGFFPNNDNSTNELLKKMS